MVTQHIFHKLKQISSTRSLKYQQDNIHLDWLPSMDRVTYIPASYYV